MSLLPSKAQVIRALSDTQAQSAAAQSAQFLVQLSKNAGYAMLLIQIFDEEYLNIQTKHRILQELKRHLKSNWRARNNQITAQERQQIKDSIIPSFLHCPPQHILIKTYKEAFEAIICLQYRNWNIIPTVLEQLSLGQKIPQCLQLLLAFASPFQFSITEQERTHFYTLTTAVLPVLLQLLSHNSNNQIMYLSIKFLWKAVHYEISSAVKEITLCWMPILQTIVGSSNPKYDNNVHQTQQRGSEQFYYFHLKKWATRILSRLIEKHTKKISFNRNNDNRQFNQKWYSEYGDKFILILIQQFSINTTKKNRFFQLKCMNTLIVECPDKVKQYSQQFQYDILLNFLRLSPQDEELALKQPSKFIEKQNEPGSIITQIRSPATDVWIRFSELGQTKGQGLIYKPGMFFMQNLEYLKGKLQERDGKQLQLALYLLSSISTVVKKCRSAHPIIQKMIIQHVTPNFKNSNLYVRARALEVFTKYNFIQYENSIFQQSLQAICDCILKEGHNFVKLKAISAFSFVASYKHAKSITIPFLKQILNTVLQLMQQYGQQSTGKDFQIIIYNVGSQISHFAYFIICRLHKIYSKMVKMNEQFQNQHQYNGYKQLAQICLKAVKQIIQSPLQQTIIRQIQPQILSIFQSAFMWQQNDYIEDSLLILETFILKVEEISQMLWCFYPFIIFNIIGARRYKLLQFNKIFKQNKGQYFKKRMEEGNIQMLEPSSLVLRNYIVKISLMTSQPNYQRFKSELISLLFHLINQTYKRGVRDQLGYQSGLFNIFLCTSLMINLIQNFNHSLPPNLYIQIWQFSRRNLQQFPSRKLNQINSQLIGLLLWASPLSILTVAKRQNMLQIIVAYVTSKNYEQQHQRARLILGINSVLSLPQKPSFIMPKIVDLFKKNIKLVKENIKKRLNIYPILAYMDSEEQNQNQYYDDAQDQFLHQKFDSNSIALNMIDEVQQFEQVLQKLRILDGNLYQNLTNSIEDNITELIQNIRMAPKKSK